MGVRIELESCEDCRYIIKSFYIRDQGSMNDVVIIANCGKAAKGQIYMKHRVSEPSIEPIPEWCPLRCE